MIEANSSKTTKNITSCQFCAVNTHKKQKKVLQIDTAQVNTFCTFSPEFSTP